MPCCIARVHVHWPCPWQREERWGRTPDSWHLEPWLGGGGSIGCSFLYPPTLISSADELGATIHVSEQQENGGAAVLSGDGDGDVDGDGGGDDASCD